MKALNFLMLGVALCLLCTCSGDSNSSSSASSQGNITVSLSSSVLSRPGRTACSLTLSSGPVSGECLTPTKFIAKALKITTSSNLEDSNGVRLIDLAAAPSDSGLDGPFGVLGLADFDFSSASATTNQYSEDNIQDQSLDDVVYNVISVFVGALETQFEIPSANSNVTNRFWTVRYVFFPKNPLDISTFASCPTDTGMRTQMQSDGDLYSSPSGFVQGDVLICQKSTQSATCENSDFNFISSTDGSLSTTRPSSPVQLSNSFWLSSASCEGTQMDFGPGKFISQVSSPFKFEKVQVTPESGTPYFNYTYTPDCSTSTKECTGTAISAQKLTMSVAFDLTNAIFAHNSVNLETDTEANLLKNMAVILPKPFYVGNTATGFGDVDQNTGVSVTLTVSETSS